MQKERSSVFVRSDTVLPPGIAGPAKGEVLLLFRWTSAHRSTQASVPGRQHATVTWWGQSYPSTIVSLKDVTDMGVMYVVACGPKAFSRYLQDMKSLNIKFAVQHGKAECVAQEDVNICKLSSGTPVQSRTAVTAPDGRLLGTAAVTISISYTPLVSSFEMNEHLASVDHSMPLFPRSNRITTPLRQLNLQAGHSTPAVAAPHASLADPLFQHESAHSTTPQSAALSAADQPELSLALAIEYLVQLIDRCSVHLCPLYTCKHFLRSLFALPELYQ